MGIYIRAYQDYSYELIYTDGTLRKKRIHILINPGKHAKLQGQKSKLDTEINIQSLTHILAMETSVIDNEIIDRTKKIAQVTNKPIITNSTSGEKFKEVGISVKQLRILGFGEEIIEGLSVDPIYLEEIGSISNKGSSDPEEDKDTEESFSAKQIPQKVFNTTKQVVGMLNPLKWKPVKAVKNTVLPDEPKIDPNNPLAVYLKFASKQDVVIPLDKRAQTHITEIIPDTKPYLVVLPHLDVSQTTDIKGNLKTLLILNEANEGDKVLVIPKTHNTNTKHDTIYAGFGEWVDIEEQLR